jgi:hypothetical protein
VPALLSLLAALTIAAASPSLVRGLDDTPASSLRDRTTSSTQEWVAVLPTGVLFEAAGSDGAIRLWTSDGTAAGTTSLAAVDAYDRVHVQRRPAALNCITAPARPAIPSARARRCSNRAALRDRIDRLWPRPALQRVHQ